MKVGPDDEVVESGLWRLYGASPVSLNNGNFSSNRPGRKWLFPSTLGDSDVQSLVKGLNNLPVSCQDHHQSKQPTLEQKYGQFLTALASYTKFHKQERTKDTARLLIWTCDPKDMCGGLGDRLRGVTYVLILAMASQRVLLLDWSDSSFSKVTYMRPNMINWQLTQEEQKLVSLKNDSVKQFNLGRRGKRDLSSLLMKLKLIEGGEWKWIVVKCNNLPKSLVYGETAVSLDWLKGNMTKFGLDKLSVMDLESLVGIAFRYLFKFSAEIQKQVQAARKVLALPNYIALHVRTGFVGTSIKDYHHPKLYSRTWQWDKMLHCAYQYATQQLGRNAVIYLATDSPLVKDRALAKYGVQRVRCLNNTLMHVNFPDKSSSLSKEDFDRQGLMSMWVELILLAEAHSLVMGRSGFAHLAKSLCLAPKERVIDGLICKPLSKEEATSSHS